MGVAFSGVLCKVVCSCRDGFLCQPLFGRQTCDGLEGTEESRLAGEARLFNHCHQFHVGVIGEESLRMTNAIFSNQLCKGTMTLTADTVSQIGNADPQIDSYVGWLEARCKIPLVALYPLTDPLHQLFI